ncbi:MAG TPA: hypothetical protein DF383_05015 [Deltaproteobacteria bacterium]|nr:hypothetical protein [Deltaproteobacteria bacterium]
MQNLPRPNSIDLIKEHPDLPDFYGITVHFRNGDSKKFEVAQHSYLQNPARLEFVTHDNHWNCILWDSVAWLEFDKAFSKVVEIHGQRKNERLPT